MKTRLFNLAAAVSLLLAVVIVVLWVRSCARSEEIARSSKAFTELRRWEIKSGYGSLDFVITRSSGVGAPGAATNYWYLDWTRSDHRVANQMPWFPFPPMHFQHFSVPRSNYDLKQVTIAYWLLLPLALILPTIAFARYRRRRRRQAGNLCPTCGYDLRAHSAGDRCPECGMEKPCAV